MKSVSSILSGEFAGTPWRNQLALAVGKPGEPSRFLMEEIYELGNEYTNSFTVNHSASISFESKPESIHRTDSNVAVHLEDGRVRTWPVRDEAITQLSNVDTVVGGRSFGLALSAGIIRAWGTPQDEAFVLQRLHSRLENSVVEELWGDYGMFFINARNTQGAEFGIVFQEFEDHSVSAIVQAKFDEVVCFDSVLMIFDHCLTFHMSGQTVVGNVWSSVTNIPKSLSVSGKTSRVKEVQMDYAELLVLLEDGKAIQLRGNKKPPADALQNVDKLISPSAVQLKDGRVFAWGDGFTNSDIGTFDDATFISKTLLLLKEGKVTFQTAGNGLDTGIASANIPDGVVSFDLCRYPASSYNQCALRMQNGTYYLPAYNARTQELVDTAKGRSILLLLDKEGHVMALRASLYAGDYLTCYVPNPIVETNLIDLPVSNELYDLGRFIGELNETDATTRLWGAFSTNGFGNATTFLSDTQVRRLWSFSNGGIVEKLDQSLDLVSVFGKERLALVPSDDLVYVGYGGSSIVAMLTRSGVLHLQGVPATAISKTVIGVTQVFPPEGWSLFIVQNNKLFWIMNNGIVIVPIQVPGIVVNEPLKDLKCVPVQSGDCWAIRHDGTMFAFKNNKDVYELPETMQNAVQLLRSSKHLAVRLENGDLYHSVDGTLLPVIKSVTNAAFFTSAAEEALLVTTHTSGVSAIHVVRNGVRQVLETFRQEDSVFLSSRRMYILSTDGSLTIRPDVRSPAKEGRFKSVFVSRPFNLDFGWIDAVAIRMDGSLAVFGSSLAEEKLAYFQSSRPVKYSRAFLTKYGVLATNTQGNDGVICTQYRCSPISTTLEADSGLEATQAPTLDDGLGLEATQAPTDLTATHAPTSKEVTDAPVTAFKPTFNPTVSPIPKVGVDSLQEGQDSQLSVVVVAVGASGGTLFLLGLVFAFYRRQQREKVSHPDVDSESMVPIPFEEEDGFLFDAFLTHDWGEDGSNHEAVKVINKYLKKNSLRTWFDEERLTGNIDTQITRGLESSRKVVVFVTRRYMHKLNSDDEDYCREEFLAACRLRGVKNMVVCVMEPEMLSTQSWSGVLQLKLAGHLYLDFTTKESRKANLPRLVRRLRTPPSL